MCIYLHNLEGRKHHYEWDSVAKESLPSKVREVSGQQKIGKTVTILLIPTASRMHFENMFIRNLKGIFISKIVFLLFTFM